MRSVGAGVVEENGTRFSTTVSLGGHTSMGHADGPTEYQLEPFTISSRSVGVTSLFGYCVWSTTSRRNRSGAWNQTFMENSRTGTSGAK